jgi:hypothetical protein
LQHADQEILSSFSAHLNNKVADVQKSITENYRCIAERQEAKSEEVHVMSDEYKFKKRENEEQHKLNIKVLHKLKDASKEPQEQKVEKAQ